MPTATEANTIVKGFPIPSLPKPSGNPDYAAIKETHQILTANAASVEYDLGGGQNGYLGLILLPKQYARVSGTAFVLPPNPVLTAHVPAWTVPTEEEILLCEHTEQRRLYDEYRTLNSALKNQLLVVFDDPYLSTLNNRYTGYATRLTIDLLTYLYEKYSRIYPLYMVGNDERL